MRFVPLIPVTSWDVKGMDTDSINQAYIEA